MPKRTTSLEESDTFDEQPDKSTMEQVKSPVSNTAEKTQAKVEEVGRILGVFWHRPRWSREHDQA